MGIVSINPANGKLIESFPSLSSIELYERLTKAWSAFHQYRLTSMAERAEMMRRAAAILDNNLPSGAFVELLCHNAGDDVSHAAGCEGDDEGDVAWDGCEAVHAMRPTRRDQSTLRELLME